MFTRKHVISFSVYANVNFLPAKTLQRIHLCNVQAHHEELHECVSVSIRCFDYSMLRYCVKSFVNASVDAVGINVL